MIYVLPGSSHRARLTLQINFSSTILSLFYSFCVIKSQREREKPRYKLLYTQKYFNLMPPYLFVFIIFNCFLYLNCRARASFALLLCIIFFYVTRGNSTDCNLFDVKTLRRWIRPRRCTLCWRGEDNDKKRRFSLFFLFFFAFIFPSTIALKGH